MEKRSYGTGLYTESDSARAAVEGLIESQFPSEEISVLTGDEAGASEAAIEHKSGVAPGAAIGGALGGGAGAVGGALVSIGVLPALGIGLAAAGPIAAAASAAVAGATGGGLLGTLAGMGFWTESPDLPGDLKRGGVLLALLVLPLYVPVLIFGAGSVLEHMSGIETRAQIYWLGVISMASLTLAPFAVHAALRVSLEQ